MVGNFHSKLVFLVKLGLAQIQDGIRIYIKSVYRAKMSSLQIL